MVKAKANFEMRDSNVPFRCRYDFGRREITVKVRKAPPGTEQARLALAAEISNTVNQSILEMWKSYDN